MIEVDVYNGKVTVGDTVLWYSESYNSFRTGKITKIMYGVTYYYVDSIPSTRITVITNDRNKYNQLNTLTKLNKIFKVTKPQNTETRPSNNYNWDYNWENK